MPRGEATRRHHRQRVINNKSRLFYLPGCYYNRDNFDDLQAWGKLSKTSLAKFLYHDSQWDNRSRSILTRRDKQRLARDVEMLDD